MRIFWSAELPCAFFVNGVCLGTVDGFERSTEIDPADGVFCELKPAGSYAPVRFRLDENFLFAPPEGVELYFFGGAAAVHAKDFFRADPTPRVIWQKHLGGARFTLTVQGRVTLGIGTGERAAVQVALPFSFEESVLSEAGGMFLLESPRAFALFGTDGEVYALSDGKIVGRGARVTAEIPLSDSRGHTVRRTWENGRAETCAVTAASDPTEATFALAFFESLPIGAGPLPCLAPALAEKAALLRQYLGDYRAAVPTERTDTVGLIYERKPRVFDVRRFRITLEGGKISNIRAE